MDRNNQKFVLKTIKDVDSKAISVRTAAHRLGTSRQYINRLLKRYRIEGDTFLLHKNNGKTRLWKTNNETETKIVLLYREKYKGFNFSHFLEKLNEIEDIKISYQPLYRILKNAGFLSPKKHHKRKKENLHPSRSRRECFGELLQIDASLHNWFGPLFPKATLHGAIDDATGTVMGLFFDKYETLYGYYHMFREILLHYGIPEAFYSDNRSIFEFRKLSEIGQTIDRNINIQFKRCCNQLGVTLITTSVSQAKGRVERLWGTLQSRLISELSLHNIVDISSANDFLDEFTRDYNRRFALPIDYESSLFVEPPTPKEIDYYLSVEYERITDNGSTISLFSTHYQLVNENGIIISIPAKTKIRVFKTFSNTLVAFYNDTFYDLYPTTIHKTNSHAPHNKKPGRPSWKPGPDHPWKKYFKLNN